MYYHIIRKTSSNYKHFFLKTASDAICYWAERLGSIKALISGSRQYTEVGSIGLVQYMLDPMLLNNY